MKYVIAALLLGVLIYLLSFARNNWNNKNKLAAVGATVMGVAAIGLSYYVIFFRL